MVAMSPPEASHRLGGKSEDSHEKISWGSSFIEHLNEGLLCTLCTCEGAQGHSLQGIHSWNQEQ